MTRVLQRGQIDIERWDALVLKSPFFKHYYLSSYLDAASENWCALVAEDYKWVWPLPFKLKWTKKVYQPLLCQQLGPIGSEKLSNEELLHSLSILEKSFNFWNVKFNDCYTELPFKGIKKHRNITLSLDQDYGTLSSSYKRSVITSLKKFPNDGSIILENEYSHWAINAFRSSSRYKSLSILNDDFYARVKKIYLAFERDSAAFTVSAKIADRIVGQILVLEAGKRLLILFTALIDEGRKFGAMHAIFDHLIARYANKEGYILDFEGSNDDKVAQFYRSFGGEEHVYLQSHKLSPLERLKYFSKND